MFRGGDDDEPDNGVADAGVEAPTGAADDAVTGGGGSPGGCGGSGTHPSDRGAGAIALLVIAAALRRFASARHGDRASDPL